MPEFLITLLAVVFLVIAGVSLVGCAGVIGSALEREAPFFVTKVRSLLAEVLSKGNPVGRAGKRIA